MRRSALAQSLQDAIDQFVYLVRCLGGRYIRRGGEAVDEAFHTARIIPVPRSKTACVRRLTSPQPDEKADFKNIFRDCDRRFSGRPNPADLTYSRY
jgi:hypothetical protein